ncbi:MAG: hypothetical protein IKD72_04015 [Clostridia bacterium]|nr:hypothetical protein [Clostridia bacterium]
MTQTAAGIPLFSESLSPRCKRDKKPPEVTTAECRRNKAGRFDRVKVAERRAQRGTTGGTVEPSLHPVTAGWGVFVFERKLLKWDL